MFRSVTPLALLICFLNASHLHAQVPVSAAVADEATRGAVRVLIRLQTSITPEGRLGAPSAVADQRQRIAAAQERISRALGGPARLRRFRSVPWLATEVTAAQLAMLRRHPAVAAITRDGLMRPALAQSVPFIGAPTFWQVGYRADGWMVAMLDTGVDGSHPALAGRVVHEACFSTTSAAENATSLCLGGAESALGSGSAPPCAASIHGCEHGTVMAGVVGGRAASVSGVAPNVRLTSIQVYSRIDNAALCQGPTPCVLSFTSDQIAGLEHVLDLAGPSNAARIAVANLSLSGTRFATSCDSAEGMPAFKAAVDNLRAIGIATVVAAGNEGDVSGIGEPACVSTVVSVGASLGDADVISGLSNRASFLSLLAPGTDVTSSTPGGGSGTFAGSSLSAAFVSGGWALLRQFMPNVPVSTLLSALRSTGAPVPDATGLIYPRIRLVEAALSANGGYPVPPGVPGNGSLIVDGNNVTFSWQPPSTGNGVTRYVVSAGTQAGASDLGSFDVGLTTSIAALVGTGTYFARVHADNPGGPGAATADQMFTISPPVPPAAPMLLTSQIAGTTVTLSWQAPVAGSPPSSYIVEAGSASLLADQAIFDTASPQSGVTVTAVPPATYYVRVRAKNAAGISVPSAEIIVTVP